jgi:hypothetical protein
MFTCSSGFKQNDEWSDVDPLPPEGDKQIDFAVVDSSTLTENTSSISETTKRLSNGGAAKRNNSNNR